MSVANEKNDSYIHPKLEAFKDVENPEIRAELENIYKYGREREKAAKKARQNIVPAQVAVQKEEPKKEESGSGGMIVLGVLLVGSYFLLKDLKPVKSESSPVPPPTPEPKAPEENPISSK